MDIDSQPIEVNAQFHTISGYSAHADQSDLLGFVTGIPTQPKVVHLIHGEKKAKKRVRREIGSRGNLGGLLN
ncbi:MBL fold metallo-hydrolase RNA specificity domain-containing protein [Vibrio owensii]|uniref:MBL fold metallo-hydrolase RNA specificity domain-containing protein n=1 Tax=Vibrio owensii TaxID=696485 RepID=UPI003AADB0FE